MRQVAFAGVADMGLAQVLHQRHRVLHPPHDAGVGGEGHHLVGLNAQVAGVRGLILPQQLIDQPKQLLHHSVLAQIVARLDQLPVLPQVAVDDLNLLGLIDAAHMVHAIPHALDGGEGPTVLAVGLHLHRVARRRQQIQLAQLALHLARHAHLLCVLRERHACQFDVRLQQHLHLGDDWRRLLALPQALHQRCGRSHLVGIHLELNARPALPGAVPIAQREDLVQGVVGVILRQAEEDVVQQRVEAVVKAPAGLRVGHARRHLVHQGEELVGRGV
mmetsp:Transcript_32006/g.81942  ORF Transcript_32006/g.81942 Transcript_32006/m.81942 type:complete len:275 (-) Transcript_32006:869-1693(-)